jgi:hypothetical protein
MDEVFLLKRRVIMQDLQHLGSGAKAARAGACFFLCSRAWSRFPELSSPRVERFASECHFLPPRSWPSGCGVRDRARSPGEGRVDAHGFPARVCSGGSSAQRDCRGGIRFFGRGSLRQAVHFGLCEVSLFFGSPVNACATGASRPEGVSTLGRGAGEPLRQP